MERRWTLGVIVPDGGRGPNNARVFCEWLRYVPRDANDFSGVVFFRIGVVWARGCG
jgi:hypothetical protein